MNAIILKQLNEENKKSNLLSEIVGGMILSRNVSSTKCANYISGKAQRSSKIKRVERFYAHGYLDQDTSAKFMIDCIKGNYVAIMDRTNWKRGNNDINCLVVYGKSQHACGMINLELLDNKGGCSNFADRKNVLDPVFHYTTERLQALLCDREFFSFEFVAYLLQRNIPFVIRIKQNLKFAQPLIRSLRCSSKVSRSVLVGEFKGKPLYLDIAGKKLKDEYLLVVSYKVHNPLKVYRERWHIECFFKCLKTAGFNVENTHMTKLDRLKTLLLLCGMAYLMCVFLGVLAHLRVEKIKFKRTLGCFQFSFFRYGLDWLTQFLFSTRADPSMRNPLQILELHQRALSTVR